MKGAASVSSSGDGMGGASESARLYNETDCESAPGELGGR